MRNGRLLLAGLMATLAVGGGCAESGTSTAAAPRSEPTRSARALVDTSSPVMVKDIWPGSQGGSPDQLVAFNGMLYFHAAPGFTGWELWKSDGTEAGTVRVQEQVSPGTGTTGTGGERPVIVGGALLWPGYHSDTGYELWRSDGTGVGTVLVKDIWPGTGASDPLYFAVANGVLFFRADDGTHGRELWKSDGTETGTVLLKDIYPGATMGNPGFLYGLEDGRVFFSADDGTHGYEPWVSDGTEKGTVLLKDINTGTSGSSPANFLLFNGNIFFTAAGPGAEETELWKSDGTEAGTVRLKDINPGTSGSYPNRLVRMNGQLFFSALDATAGRELWRSDGTEAGTVRVKDINPGSGSSGPTMPAVMGTTLFFNASDGQSGAELWKSDGTEAGTVRVKDIRVGTGSSSPLYLTEAKGTLYFTADDGVNGTELWKSDGTPEGTQLVADINPGSASSTPKALTVVGNNLYFIATDGVHGVELWRLSLADTTPPTVTCPGPVKASATSAEGAAVDYPAATAGDDVTASPALSYSRASGSVFPLGSTQVTVTATDEAGNKASCTFSVTVEDTTPPGVTCPAPMTAEATSPTGALVSYSSASASDAVTASPVLSYSRASGEPFALGATDVTVTAKDAAGNEGSCVFRVTVRDTTAPEVGCPGPLVAEAQDSTGANVVFSTAKPRDAVTLEPAVSLSHAPGSRFPLGTTTVVLKATDEADNEASCSFSVTVGDTTAPSLTCPANLTVDTHAPEGAVVDYSEATASDAVSSPVQVRSSVASGSHFAPGTTPVTVTATDRAGNSATCTFQVSVRYLPVVVPAPGSGCGCTAGAGPAGFGWGLLLLGWGAMRRRRSR